MLDSSIAQCTFLSRTSPSVRLAPHDVHPRDSVGEYTPYMSSSDVLYDMPRRLKLPMTGATLSVHGILGSLMALLIIFPTDVVARQNGVPLTMNGVAIRGVRETFEANFGPEDTLQRAALREAVKRDGFDSVLLQHEDSVLSVVYGYDLLFYADSTSRIRTAMSYGRRVTVLDVDDENHEFDARRPMGVVMLTALFVIVVAGGVVGGISGSVARRGIASLGRDPLLEHIGYGLVIGLLLALLAFGLSERKIDLDGLLATYGTEHFDPFMKHPPVRP